MRLKTGFAAAVVGAGCLFAAGGAGAASVIVDISSLTSEGTTVNLAAGVWTVNFIDVAGGGLYGGYNPWNNVAGCDINGMNCANGFIENLGIDFGHGSGNFDRQDGLQNGLVAVPGDNHVYATAVQALASIQTGTISQAPIASYQSPGAYSPIANPITFTLGGAQSVNFLIFDDPRGDNFGGVSLRLTTPDPDPQTGGGVPEPAGWALMIAGMGGLGAVLRSRRRVALA
jgi:hypothetical protein